MALLDKVSAVSISESAGYGGINEDYFVSVRDAETIEAFENVIEAAKVNDEKPMKQKPDYDILVHYENGDTHGLHLILGDEGEQSMLMYIGHENDGFSVSPKDTRSLREIVTAP